jgi:hypothetical protein
MKTASLLNPVLSAIACNPALSFVLCVDRFLSSRRGDVSRISPSFSLIFCCCLVTFFWQSGGFFLNKPIYVQVKTWCPQQRQEIKLTLECTGEPSGIVVSGFPFSCSAACEVRTSSCLLKSDRVTTGRSDKEVS